MSGHVFISHSTRNDPDVAALREALEGLGVHAWTDSRELVAGDSLEPDVERAIEEARHVVVLLGPEAVSSPWVQKEVEHALRVQESQDDGYRVIPILIDPIDYGVLNLFFGDEPVGLEYRSAPGAVAELLPDLLTALGLRAPEDSEDAAPDPAPEIAELTLVLRDPEIVRLGGADPSDGNGDGGGARRAGATAQLVYDPPPGSGERRVESPRFAFTAPLGAIEAGELAWYLERYHQWPSGPFEERARRVEASLADWGRQLAEPLLCPDAREPYEAWRRASDGTVRRLSVLVDAEPVKGSGAGQDDDADGRMKEAATLLLGLPWELVHDGEGFLFEGARGVRVRRRLPHRRSVEPLVTATPVRMLLVSPRPEDERAAYLDHRVSARPLVEALEPLGELAELTLLTPPTLPALEAELLRARQAGEPYQVVHFDGHGVYDRKHGLGGLCFEDPADVGKLEKRRSKIVQADELAPVMREHRVPLVFLEACQSAMAEEDPTASVAGRLLDGGVASVVAMSHSVLVETARRFVGAFYRELVAGRRVGSAMLAGQRALARDTSRGRRFTGELHLQDWFVPVLFQEEQDPRLIARVPAERVQEVAAERRKRALGALPEVPEHSFVGRSRELLKAERLLTHEAREDGDRYAVLLGEGGEGKTTLAAELARWLVATRRFERAAFVSVESLPDARRVLYALGEQLVPDFLGQAAGDDARARRLVERALRDRATLLVVDNVESVLPPPQGSDGAAAASVYEPEVLEALFDLCRGLLETGQTRMVFTSREALPEPFAGHRVRIDRLDRRDAVELVGRVLEREGKAPPADDPGKTEDEIGELVDAVNRHARSLVLVAREVSRAGVRHATEHLQELMEDLAARHPDDRERSLFASVELSLRRLPEATRERLPRLAVFRGGAHLGVIAAVLGLDMDRDTEKAEVVDLARQLAGVGLATPMPDGYLRFHPALAPALSRELDGDGRDEARAAWQEATEGFLRSLYELRFNKPEVAATTTLLDLPNLLAVVEGAAGGAGPDRVVDLATRLESLVENLDRPRALERVVAVRESAAGAFEGWSHARYIASAAAIQRLLDAGRFPEVVQAAERLVQEGLAAGEDAFAESAYDLAGAHWNLGRALRRAGAAEVSLRPLEEARRRFQELAEGGDRRGARMVAVALADFGDSLTALGRLDDAARAYRESVEWAEEVDDPRQVAVGKGQLGTVRLFQGRYPEALEAHQDARKTFERLGEPGSVATAWNQIGRVHAVAGEHDAAEDAYRRSLKLKVERGDRAGEASSYGNLGNLSVSRDRSEEAVRFYRRAEEIHLELGARSKEGRDRSNIAIPLMKLGRQEEARRELERAIECKAPYGHAAEPWTTFALLEDLERAVGDEEAAADARQRAIRAYLAYRRDGGENHMPGGRLAAAVQEALMYGTPGQVEELAGELARLRETADLPAAAHALIEALQALLAGSRNPALAQDPALDYDDAAEILLLLERLD